jgi:SAM-dependent methyltransferase
LAEYLAMFDLSPVDVAGSSVLDCCAGAASFTAESEGRGVAMDPVYAMGSGELATLVRDGVRDGERIIAEHADAFEWDWYGHPARRAEQRRTAADRFLLDLSRRPGRYVAGALPNLPLATGSFDLVLCSHLLFTWSDVLDEAWHRRAIAELVRVARREVRVFPLVVQGTGDPVAFLDSLRADLHAAGHRSCLRTVPYRFQRGADQMLAITVEAAST